jgi:superfamily II DNA/RNA helicase/very-short-patch-repair endonuclease
MDVFKVRDQVIDDYRAYTQGFLQIKDPDIRRKVAEELDSGLLWPEPWLALNPAFESGGSITDLVAEGLLHPTCEQVFRIKLNPNDSGQQVIRLHKHQRQAVEIARKGRPYVVTTGTGSGKSLTYIVPAVDRILRDGSGNGVRAIVVYPMNALANSQKTELEKYLEWGFDGKPPVTFERYTGQEKTEKRREILKNPPDIILTNYMMLELMLLRPDERRLLTNAGNLAFLVLDELHTYRGRQGADVAMLVRRLRQATGSSTIQCVGTSATLAGPGTVEEQQAEVAAVASRHFGVQVAPEDVVGESLRRATTGAYTPESLRARISQPPPADFAALQSDALAVWVEETFGVHEDDGVLVRSEPSTLQQAAERLRDLTGTADADLCDAAIRATLLAGANDAAVGGDGRRLFAFKLHQFISRGDTVYTTLDRGENWYLTTHKQIYVPNDPSRLLYPLAFCRECGQEYILAAKKEDGGTTYFEPREEKDQSGQKTTGYLYLSQTHPWPARTDEALLDRVPEGWITGIGDERQILPDRLGLLPDVLTLNKHGQIDPDGALHAAYMAEFRFCLNPDCLVVYENARANNFAKLASLGSEGRSSAATVLSASTVRALTRDEQVRKAARKILTFTDNRQDASLQAGHFNDFVLVTQLRAALYLAAQQHQDQTGQPLDHTQIASAVVDALNLDRNDYSRFPEAKFGAQKDRAALVEVIAYRLYADLKRGWRITMPNLEETGLLTVGYTYLDEIAADVDLWKGDEGLREDTYTVLRAATAEQRRTVMRVLLEEMRRNLCISTKYLREDGLSQVRLASEGSLIPPWALPDEQPVRAGIAFPRSRRKGDRTQTDLFISGLHAFGKWLRHRSGLTTIDGRKLKVVEAEDMIRSVLEVMAKQGIAEKTLAQDGEVPGFQISEAALLWGPGDGKNRALDVVRVSHDGDGGRVNPYFREVYTSLASELSGLRAAEHTAQVPAPLREIREEEFRSGDLKVLYCSPTMELGVDIATLNTVLMRNVPPTPANYAQRSGRAGRAGTPALVTTYCATGSGHDQFYYRRPALMVSGKVQPPRLDLANEDLCRAHVQSIWLAETGQDFSKPMQEIVDIDDPKLPLRSEVREALSTKGAKDRALVAAGAVLAATPEVAKAPWWKSGWLREVIDHAPTQFDRSINRWRDLYTIAHTEAARQTAIKNNLSVTRAERNAADARRREAEAQIALLRGDVEDKNQSDFYPYRYLASEGFLPGYSFPRLPLAAFIPGGRQIKGNEGDFVQRPRFLAISEFGPGAFIYHEGARYAVTRVQLPVGSNDATGGPLLESAKRCPVCGYLHLPTGKDSVEKCERPGCDADLGGGYENNLLRLQTVITQRRDRINADEEERARAGFLLETAVRFEPHGERSSHTIIEVTDAAGERLATLTYGDTALIRRFNTGYRRAKVRNGFPLNLTTGRWGKTADTPAAEAAELSDEEVATGKQTSLVVPYVQDRCNALLVEFEQHLDDDVKIALQYALKRGIAIAFQLEDSELAVEPLPSREDRRLLLFYENAEGGAGALRRFAMDTTSFRQAVRAALDVCHFDPETGKDLGHAPPTRPGHQPERCERACYDCLLAYTNQPDHLALNRHAALNPLLMLRDAALVVGSGGVDRTESYQALLAQSTTSAEESWVEWVFEKGLRLPNHAQYRIDDAQAVPDFVYADRDARVAVYVDGPVHNHQHIQKRDAHAEARLMSKGWLVVRFPIQQQHTWDALCADLRDVFGEGKTL